MTLEILKRIKQADELYEVELRQIAEMIRNAYVIPYCEKHNCYFIAGMGGWSFYGTKDHEPIDDQRLPKRLNSMLCSEPDYCPYFVSNFIRDYYPKGHSNHDK